VLPGVRPDDRQRQPRRLVVPDRQLAVEQRLLLAGEHVHERRPVRRPVHPQHRLLGPGLLTWPGSGKCVSSPSPSWWRCPWWPPAVAAVAAGPPNRRSWMRPVSREKKPPGNGTGSTTSSSRFAISAIRCDTRVTRRGRPIELKR